MKKEHVVCVKKHIVGFDEVKSLMKMRKHCYRAKNETLGNTRPA